MKFIQLLKTILYHLQYSVRLQLYQTLITGFSLLSSKIPRLIKCFEIDSHKYDIILCGSLMLYYCVSYFFSF